MTIPLQNLSFDFKFYFRTANSSFLFWCKFFFCVDNRAKISESNLEGQRLGLFFSLAGSWRARPADGSNQHSSLITLLAVSVSLHSRSLPPSNLFHSLDKLYSHKCRLEKKNFVAHIYMFVMLNCVIKCDRFIDNEWHNKSSLLLLFLQERFYYDR